jgi:type I restriction enzyme S subunit
MTTIAANIGDFSMASYPVACPDSVVGIEPKDGIDTFWLYSALSCFKSALDRASTQNAQKNINLQTLRPLIVPVPPQRLMLEISETLSSAGTASEEAERGLEKLKALKSATMSDLLSGRVRVPA